MLDICITLLLCVPVGLVIGIFALLIRFDSPGPIFFRQRRVGQQGREFSLLKLRSMYVDGDDSRHKAALVKYLQDQPIDEHAGGSFVYKQVDDPRVTRVGRFIRKTSIDELPQFLNVLRGEMTLVGPRPPLPYEMQFYTPHDKLRLVGKPGLTGPWQIYGRSRVPFHTMVEMDIAYLQRQSVLEDLRLICLTVPVMLDGRGGM